MQTSTTITEIAKALAEAQGEFRGVQKSGNNKFDNYSYAKLEDYVRSVGNAMHRHGLSRVASVEEIFPLEDRETSNGKKEHVVRVKLLMRIMHTSGEWIEVPSFGEGQDRGDKAIYKAITGAHKYALASAMGLATTDDPENDDPDDKPTPQPQSNRQPPPPRQPNKPTPKQTQTETGEAITPEQTLHLMSLIQASSDSDKTHQFVLSKYKINDLDKLTSRQAATVIEAMKRAASKPKPAKKAA